jgi:hypothetical protein
MNCYFVTSYCKLIYFIPSEGLKQRFLSRLLQYVQVPHMLPTLKPYYNM